MPRDAEFPYSQYTPDELKHSCIYHIYRLDGEQQDEYIGQAVHLRHRWHKHMRELRLGINTAHLQRAWDKYGAEAFGWEVLEWVDNKRKLDDREQWYIDERKPRYNLCLFVGRSRLGVKARPETLAKMREAQKNSAFSPLARTRSLEARLGKKQDPELIAKRAAAIKARGKTPEREAYYARRRGAKTGPKPPEVREKISRAKSGVQWTEARRTAQKPRELSANEQARLEAGQNYQRQRSQQRLETVLAALHELGWVPHVPVLLMKAVKSLMERYSMSRDNVYRSLRHFVKEGIITVEGYAVSSEPSTHLTQAMLFEEDAS